MGRIYKQIQFAFGTNPVIITNGRVWKWYEEHYKIKRIKDHEFYYAQARKKEVI